MRSDIEGGVFYLRRDRQDYAERLEGIVALSENGAMWMRVVFDHWVVDGFSVELVASKIPLPGSGITCFSLFLYINC